MRSEVWINSTRNLVVQYWKWSVAFSGEIAKPPHTFYGNNLCTNILSQAIVLTYMWFPIIPRTGLFLLQYLVAVVKRQNCGCFSNVKSMITGARWGEGSLSVLFLGIVRYPVYMMVNLDLEKITWLLRRSVIEIHLLDNMIAMLNENLLHLFQEWTTKKAPNKRHRRVIWQTNNDMNICWLNRR